MALAAEEQYLLELVNRGRLDPLGEAQRYGVDLNEGLPDGTISTQALQALAPSDTLTRSATDHSTWMLATNTFSHGGALGSNPGERMAAAGYEFVGRWSWRENLAWYGTSGTLDKQAAIAHHHKGLYESAGHRANTFTTNIREVGIAQVEGRFTLSGTTYNSSMTTLNFAVSGTDVFVTGVAYRDTDGDAFYGIGEGRAGVSFTAGGQTGVTAEAGGYGVAVTATAGLLVQIDDADQTLGTVQVDASGGNVKLDLVTDTNGQHTVFSAGHTTLVDGLTSAALLGSADLRLTGNAADNMLAGNRGSNMIDGAAGDDHIAGSAGSDNLIGGAGDDTLLGGNGRPSAFGTAAANADTLHGGAGHDRLNGQSGADILDGGAGDDLLNGGGGRDTFIFNSGADTIEDFTDHVDLIHLDRDALGQTDSDLQDLFAMATIDNGDAVFDFGNGNVLTINDVADLSSLTDDIVFI